MTVLNENQQRLKAQFIENRGYWSPLWQMVLELSPEFFEAYTDFSSVPWKHGPLPPPVKELIYVAVNIATTHLYLPGARTHMANAIRFGASREELLEVIQLVSTLGLHACAAGLPVLVEELARAGQPVASPERDADTRERADVLTALHGDCPEAWDALHGMAPEFYDAAAALAAIPWQRGVLAPKVRALVYVAVNAVTTQLYLPGLRAAMAKAIDLGAGRDEIMEVLMLVSAIGIHSSNEGVPMLLKTLQQAPGRDDS
jgi:alkylhydroperoxidase/carboxymuconolactone decarboxylase family protein YurZ